MPKSTERSISVREIADEKQITTAAVLRWIRLGRLPAHRVKGTQKWWVNRADLDAMTEYSSAPRNDR